MSVRQVFHDCLSGSVSKLHQEHFWVLTLKNQYHHTSNFHCLGIEDFEFSGMVARFELGDGRLVLKKFNIWPAEPHTSTTTLLKRMTNKLI
jgi:hypothetical protein